MTCPEELGYTEAWVPPVTRKSTGGDTKSLKEAAYEVETEFDEVVRKVIKKIESYNISFTIEIIVSH